MCLKRLTVDNRVAHIGAIEGESVTTSVHFKENVTKRPFSEGEARPQSESQRVRNGVVTSRCQKVVSLTTMVVTFTVTVENGMTADLSCVAGRHVISN